VLVLKGDDSFVYVRIGVIVLCITRRMSSRYSMLGLIIGHWCLSGGKRGDYQNCSMLHCVLKLCTVISTL